MAELKDIEFILFHGFRPYVTKAKLEKYDTEFSMIKRFTTKSLLAFYPKYINEKVWMKKPKERRDTYLFNYYFIEAPVLGFKKSKLLNQYIHDKHIKHKGFVGL